jgi:hypothetical protein
MHHNTTCTCKACANIPNLDLKLFVHFGEYIMQDRSEEKWVWQSINPGTMRLVVSVLITTVLSPLQAAMVASSPIAAIESPTTAIASAQG